MTDLSIFESGNGGDLVFLEQDFQLVSGLYNNVYLLLFGGNVEANTSDEVLNGEQRFDWWGNSLLYNNSPELQFNSNFERVLKQTALTSSGRAELERVALSDLQPLSDLADIEVGVFLSGNDRITINITLTEKVRGVPESMQFVWSQTSGELIVNKTI